MTWNQGIDGWFECVAERPCLQDDAVDRLDEISKLRPHRRNFDKFVEALARVKAPWQPALQKFVDDMQARTFKNEFRYFSNDRFGNVSQVSELFSLFRQALHYHCH